MRNTAAALRNRIAAIVATPRPDAPLVAANVRRLAGNEFADLDNEVGRIVASALTTTEQVA